MAHQARVALTENRVQMGSNCVHGIYAPGGMFVFGALNFVTDSAGCLNLIDPLAEVHVLFFGNLEFVTDQRGDLRLCDPTPCRVQDPMAIFNNPPASHFIAMVDSFHHVLEERESEEEESSSSCPDAILAAVYMVDTGNNDSQPTPPPVEDAKFDIEAAARELAVLTTPVPGNDAASKALEEQPKKMQLIHVRQQRECDRLVEKQSRLLASLEHVLDLWAPQASAANVKELAN